MNIKQLEREITKALDINSNVNWDYAELTPNEEFKELKKFVRKLFKEYIQGD
jgi:hypothetical protein